MEKIPFVQQKTKHDSSRGGGGGGCICAVCLLEMVMLPAQHWVHRAIRPLGAPCAEEGCPLWLGATLDGALPLHHLPCLPWTLPEWKLPPWMFCCLQQVTWSRSCWRPWFSPFSLLIKKFVFWLIFSPQWISSGRRGWESGTLPIPLHSFCLFRRGSFSLQEGEHWVRESSCEPSD